MLGWNSSRRRGSNRTTLTQVNRVLRAAIEPLEGRTLLAAAFGLTNSSELIRFDTATPGTAATLPITGISAGESLVGIDFRPVNGVLYGLGVNAAADTATLYSISTGTGAASSIGAVGSIALVETDGTTPIDLPDPAAVGYGLDFNPTVDRIRVVAGTLNFRINPNSGAVVDTGGASGVQPDTDLAYGAGPFFGVNPAVVEVAYDRNFQGSTLTTLFGIDTSLDQLVISGGVDGIPSPNGGVLTALGGLGIDAQGNGGFEITAPGTALAALTVGGVTGLYTIDLVTALATLVGNIDTGATPLRGLSVMHRDDIVVATTTTNRLVSFRTSEPETLLTSVPITGLLGGETIAGIDFRPATGELFALSSLNRVLTINTSTAVATAVGATGGTYGAAAQAGFDINPAVDRLRLVNAANDSARFNPVTNTFVQDDTDLAYIATDPNVGVDPNIVAAAYDRNDNNGATATTLFTIDSTLNNLVRQGAVDGNAADVAGGGSPNAGLLTTLGSLGVDPTNLVGFDIIDAGTNGNGAALAVMQLNGEAVSKLFRINLTAGLVNQPLGTAMLVGTVGGGVVMTAMAIAPEGVAAPPTINVTDVTLVEGHAGQKAFNFTLTRAGTDLSLSSTVDFFTSDGTAFGGSDYVSTSGSVLFLPNQTARTVTVFVNGDTTFEPDETFFLNLITPFNATVFFPQGTGTIVNDDAAPPPSASVSIVTDPCDSSKTAVKIEGTDNGETIVVTKSGSSQGKVVVKINGSNKGTFNFSGSILVYGKKGNDTISIDGAITRSALIFGGDGNDTANGGGGADLILGEGGNDSLKGNAGRDLLIGGTGVDRLDGGSSDDILVAGSTIHDGNLSSLCSLLDEWKRTDKGYSTRVDHIRNGGGLNGSIKLNASTVSSSGAVVDRLTGGSNTDLFIAAVPGDVLTDRVGGETVVDVG